jgi:hypothetical protein
LKIFIVSIWINILINAVALGAQDSSCATQAGVGGCLEKVAAQFFSGSSSSNKKFACVAKNAIGKLGKGFSESCSGFVDPNGKYNKGIDNYIDDHGGAESKFLQDDSSIKSVCPNWANLSSEERKGVWKWNLASLSEAESSCREAPPIVATGKNKGLTVGLFQLDLSTENRDWRGPNCGGSRAVMEIGVNNLNCTLDFFNEWLDTSSQYKSNGKFTGKGSNTQFGPLLRGDPKVMKLINQNPLCKKS